MDAELVITINRLFHYIAFIARLNINNVLHKSNNIVKG